MSDGEPRPQTGKRVFVLWLCWVVLALFLVAAGVAIVPVDG